MKTFAVILALCLIAPPATPAQTPDGAPHLYLLAATPSYKGPATFPATLYRVGAAGSLQLVRELASGSDGAEFVLADDAALIAGYPHITPDKLQIVHFDSPEIADRIDLNVSSGIASAQIAHVPGLGPMVLLGHVTSLDPFQSETIGVSLTTALSPRIVAPMDWSTLADTWYEGTPGGTQRSLAPVSPDLTPEGLKFYYGPQKRWTPMRGTAPQSIPVQLPAGSNALRTVLKCVNDRYAVFSAGSQVFVENLSTGAIRLMAAAGTGSHLRIFGSWLAVVVTEPNPGNKRANPGSENQRHIANMPRQSDSRVPPVRDFYADNVDEEWFPGTLELMNLATGQTIEMKTGQADSEILRVSDNSVLYRINRQIFRAPIADNKLGAPVTIADGDDISEVHWAFLSVN